MPPQYDPNLKATFSDEFLNAPRTPPPTTRSVAEIEKVIQDVESMPLVTQARQALENAQKNQKYLTVDVVSKAQADYDAALAFRDQHLAGYRAELAQAQARDKAEAKKQLEAERQTAKEYDERLKPQLRQAWLEAGGDPDTFEDAYPTLKARHIMENMTKNRGDANVARERF